MKAAHLPDRGAVKVTGNDARQFLHGLVSADMLALAPGAARFCALLSPQGKIIVDFLVAEAPATDGGGFFLDVPRTLAPVLVQKLNLYKLRARVLIEEMSETLGILAAWDGHGATTRGLAYADPRLPALGLRVILPPHLAATAAAELGAVLLDASAYEAHRITLGVPQGGVDFVYGETFPHEADMDQLDGVDFGKGCYVGQEVVSRMEHRGLARTRAVQVRWDGTAAPKAGAAIMAGERQIGRLGSTVADSGIALLRLDRASEAAARGEPVLVDGIAVRLVKPDWARFAFPGDPKAAAE